MILKQKYHKYASMAELAIYAKKSMSFDLTKIEIIY